MPVASSTAARSATAASRAEHAGGERRVAEAAAVPRDDAVAGVGQRGHLLEPRRVRPAGAVREHDRGRVVGADHLVVDLSPPDATVAVCQRCVIAVPAPCRRRARAPQGERVVVGERAEVVGRDEAALDELPRFGQHAGRVGDVPVPEVGREHRAEAGAVVLGRERERPGGIVGLAPEEALPCERGADVGGGAEAARRELVELRGVLVGLAQHVQRGVEVAERGRGTSSVAVLLDQLASSCARSSRSGS